MSNDLIEVLSKVGDLNDTWAESNQPERAPLYVVEPLPRPVRRGRFVVPAMVAALALVAVMATALITSSDRGVDPDQHPPAAPPAHEEATDTAAERFSGQMPDGVAWSVEIASGSGEVCYAVGEHFGCGNAPAFTVIDVSRGHQLVYGFSHGPVRGGAAPGPAIAIDLELTDGSTVSVEHVGQRIWATTLPGTSPPAAVVKEWPDGSTARTTNADSEVTPPQLTEEEQQAAQVETQREAERLRQLAEERLRD